jgi:leucyl aminopeptidase
VNIIFSKFPINISSNFVLVLSENFDLSAIKYLNEEQQKFILEAIKLRKFAGKISQEMRLVIPTIDGFKEVILLGIGVDKDFIELSALKLGGNIISMMKNLKIEKLSVILDTKLVVTNEKNNIANIALGAKLRNYSFDKYKSADKLKNKVNIIEFELFCSDDVATENLFNQELDPIAQSVYFSRDLASEPANIIYPASFVQRAEEDLSKYGIKVEVLGEKEMHDLGMNALLGVGQGSSKESKLLVMQYNGGKKDEAPLAFVGKGVTFDTGGISLKPAANMEEMKYDMSGSAIVTGLIKALAMRKAKVNIVAVVGLAENMPDGNAQRPSDVVKTMSGQTIEILNTDAEGRLVLADALWYTQDRFKPKLMIDLATLTGAIIVALANVNAGLFSNDDELAKALLDSGKDTEEKLWQLPLSDEYDKMVDSTIADVRNTGNANGAGSITAAQFLKRFVNNVKWAHLDIAGVSSSSKDADLYPAGSTGFGIRLLNNFVKKYEK